MVAPGKKKKSLNHVSLTLIIGYSKDQSSGHIGIMLERRDLC